MNDSKENAKRFEYDELVYKGRVVEAHCVGVKMHDGEVVQRDFLKYLGAAVILPVLDDGSIVMIRNYRFALGEYLWELPAGMLDEGEAPEVCAVRELAEETGYRAGKIERLGGFCATPATSDEFLDAYLATELENGTQNLETYEDITVEVLPEKKVRQMVADGTIHDGKTIASLGIYWLRK